MPTPARVISDLAAFFVSAVRCSVRTSLEFFSVRNIAGFDLDFFDERELGIEQREERLGAADVDADRS